MKNATCYHPALLPTCLLWLLLLISAASQSQQILNRQSGLPPGVIAGPLPADLPSFTARAQTGYNELRWKIIRDINLREFEIQYSLDGSNWIKAGSVPSQENSTNPDYYFKHPFNPEGIVFYRLKMTDRDGGSTLSKIITMDTHPGRGNELMLYPTTNTYGQLQAQLREPFTNLQVITMQGQVLRVQNLQNQTGIIRLNVSGFSKGTYAVVVSRPDKVISKTFLIP